MMTNSNDDRLQSGFLDWISIQRNNLKELLHVVNVGDEGPVEVLRRLADKNIQHLIDYQQIKSGQNGQDALSIYSPFWCTSLENSLFWMGGFKPSIYIRLACSTTGMRSEKLEDNHKDRKCNLLEKLLEFEKLKSVNGESSKCKGDAEECSGMQVKMIKALNASTVSRETQISSRMTNLQEGTAIESRVLIASNINSYHELECAFTAHKVALSAIVVDADELRVSVLKELMHILTPIQGIRLLIASYRLHLSIHECGKKIDQSTLRFTHIF